jgi:hypothetical protein
MGFCIVPTVSWVGWKYYSQWLNEKRTTSEEAIAITADDLGKNWSDTVHLNKVLAITGKVTGKAYGGACTIEFGAPRGMTGFMISCHPTRREEDKFCAVNFGDTVTVQGLCDGKVGDLVMLTNCRLVPKQSPQPNP